MAPSIHLIPKVLIFDLTGTCVNWYDPIVDALNSCPGLGNISPGLYFTVDVLESLDSLSADQLAKDWRAGYFAEVQARLERGEVEEDIDVTHRRVLDQLLEEGKVGVECDEGVRQRLVKKWHKLPGEWYCVCGGANDPFRVSLFCSCLHFEAEQKAAEKEAQALLF